MEQVTNKPKENKEPDTVEVYMEKKRDTEFINQSSSVFTSDFTSGINVNQSVFDKQSIFRT
jgi:hypothetical protein